ncbi:PilZ domain-containing protein [Leptospira kmetyi]|uniref:PilZ domain-containing protein n=1 Tax=Leptospira kmetyi TaxID=408139 RepID=A0A2M9XRY6_9LEPT|nr:PilZ domain-containing protein [Leptospira kmetyi]AYV56306.1 PilZ domain-containing protein [Leptospira kmetyi]PJZ29968.1 PilZ domain-containing protein [Leptospira kmetyi]PJZ42061.1 PilZ domain-containing protein [Leptospira kmetyi]TGK15870.1 PilZ domain-containing protein [Leptospira kmetyi]TGK31900.1 PilZ domain-containing protein [Leptospira kmetyi]
MKTGVTMDHRKFPRVLPATNEIIEIQLMGLNFIDILNAKDISIGGVAVEVPHLFEGCDLNSPVQMILTLPGRNPIKLSGKIKRKVAAPEASLFGVEFGALDPKAKYLIETYIQSRMQMAS